MRHARRKKGKDRVAATIALCFCLIALTSIFTIQASIDKVNENAKNLAVDQKVPTEQTQTESDSFAASENKKSNENADAEEKTGAADLPVSTKLPVVDSAESDTTKAPTYLPPMSLATASIVKDYSMDMVIYNKTLDQYMTHPGMDIEAPSGSSVNAIADGTITAVYEDDAYGTTIEITHEQGLISKYACLESSSLVEQGDTVSQGQQIGTIGKTALYEAMEASHLHFEFYKDGNLCNPTDYVSFQ